MRSESTGTGERVHKQPPEYGLDSSDNVHKTSQEKTWTKRTEINLKTRESKVTEKAELCTAEGGYPGRAASNRYNRKNVWCGEVP